MPTNFEEPSGGDLGPRTEAPGPSSPVSQAILGEAWEIVRNNLRTWIPVTLGYLLIYLVIDRGLVYLANAIVPGTARTSLIPLVYVAGHGWRLASGAAPHAGVAKLFRYLYQAVGIAFKSLVAGGYRRMAIRQLDGHPPRWIDIFSSRDVFLSLAIFEFLLTYATVFGLVFCIVPGIILDVSMVLGRSYIVDQKCSAIQAWKLSWRKTQGHRFQIFQLFLACDALVLLSALPAGLGLLFTVPLHALCKAILYRNLSNWTPVPRDRVGVAPIADPNH